MKGIPIMLLSALSLLTILIISSPSSAIAQVPTCHITGRILDDESNPVPFAAVMLKETKTGLTRGTSASDSGDFRFDVAVPGKYIITVHRAGFKPQSRDLEVVNGQTTSVTFTIAPNDVEEEPVELILPSARARTELDTQNLRWYSFDEGISLAQQTNRKLLVHVYTDWCGWCKKMDKEVFTNPEVKSVLRSYFVAAKLNAESPRELTVKGRRLSELAIAKEMGVSSYPTTVFLYPNAEPLTKVRGYIESQYFAKMLRDIGQNR